LTNRSGLLSATDNFLFAAAVAEFGMLLRQSEYRSTSNFANVLKLATGAKGRDEEGYRSEFIKLISKAQTVAKGKISEGEMRTMKKLVGRD